MAVSIIQRPDEFVSAYLPVEYTFTSDRFPNTRNSEVFETGSIYGKKTQQRNAQSTVEVGSNVVVEARLTTSISAHSVKVGSYVLLENAGEYNGVHRVTDIIFGSGNTVYTFAIDAVVESSDPINFNNFNRDGINYHPLKVQSSVRVSVYYNNFSVVTNLIIDGNFVARLRKKADPDGNFIFDYSTILQEYLGSDLASIGSTALYQDSVDLSKVFRIEFTEEFDVIDSSGTATTTLNYFLSDANEYTAVNAVIPYVNMRDFVISSTNYNLDDYAKLDTQQSQLFLTNQPSEVKIGRNDHYALSWINNVDNIIGSPVSSVEVRLYVTTFDSQGNQIADTLNIIKSATPSWKKTQSVLVGTSNLGALITPETVKYKVRIGLKDPFSPNDSTLTERKTFVIDDNCYRDEFRFEWLNKLGGIDGYTFTGKHYKTTDIEKEVFKRSLNSARSIPERQTTTLMVESRDIHQVNSGIVNYETRLWLEELLESPEVYVIVGTNRLPIQITGNYNYEKLAEDSYNVGFEFELAYDKITQRN